ncbi:glycosyltransferase family 2 protein [Campylobacter jejuni]|uniref:glycosyltransferase family 2 protein n=1 Tax=Campylobacter jejuni TaxID=197 RepID=UPI000F810549|nr:glycosyltransferase family A protein [Campylobacter jejuni]RTI58589.1 glycosyltransferase family 2 protein [Campylobacter jejuni]RTI98298.1 glycosyltransferase family 2 protein [Campylobacter jejuni]HEG3340323.1 glycosyltransferase family 2 protein [Campylobacter jejuni]
MNQTKTVGVVIPIYNVEKYLRECLDSVINQAYTNLEIILVNDGSTDNNSLNIAKEYTLKDKRITLFDKKNGGQSSARNVGIEYFSGEYKLKNKTQIIKEDSLVEFEIEGNNPYEIYTVYKSHKAFSNEQDLINFTYPIIDYIIFLDSDDYWELNCIEEWVPRMDGVDVVWFDYKPFFQGVKKKNYKTQMEHFGFKNEKIIESKDWLNRARERNIFYFWFAWQGMINFNFLQKIYLKFIDGIFAEDCHFGVLLFALSSKIYIYPYKKYIYRLRVGSLMNFTNKKIKIHSNSYLKQFDLFCDARKVKKYHEALSWYKIALEFLEYIRNNKPFFREIAELFLPVVCNRALHLKYFDEISFNFKKSVLVLEKYINNQPLGAVKRIENYLSYKIAFKIKEKGILFHILFPYEILLIVIKCLKEKYDYRRKIQINPLFKKPPLEFYRDYHRGLELQDKLCYNLIFRRILCLKSHY